MHNRNYYINNLIELLNFTIFVNKKYILKLEIKKNIYFIILQKIKILKNVISCDNFSHLKVLVAFIWIM